MWMTITDAGTHYVYTFWVYDPLYGWMPIVMALFLILAVVFVVRTVMSIFFG